jgi:acetoin utilization deacetylase AcuC-like enzyme
MFSEVPERAEIILHRVQAASLGPVHPPADHRLDPIYAVHARDYVTFLQTIYMESLPVRHQSVPGAPFLADTFVPRTPRRPARHPWAKIGRYAFDVETPFLEGTWDAAYWSAQVALTAADWIAGGARVAYALCRPPGHHALADQCGGYCYLNNAAIAARHLQSGQPAVSRVAVLDIDYHHGNGTQEIFYADPTVFYVSLHAHPDIEYPFFWGGAEERGEGPGEGYNLNLPLPKGTTDDEYVEALDQALAAIRDYAPRYLVVSAGLDIAAGDPVNINAGFAVTREGFRRIGQRIAALEMPKLIIQEGGYDLEQLGENVVAFLEALVET